VALAVVLGLDDDNFTEIVKGDLRPADLVIIGEALGANGGQSKVPPPRL